MAEPQPYHPLPRIPQEEQWDDRYQSSVAELVDERDDLQGSLQHNAPKPTFSVKRKAVPGSTFEEPDASLEESPAITAYANPPRPQSLDDPDGESTRSSRSLTTPDSARYEGAKVSLPIHGRVPSAQVRIMGEVSHSRASSGSIHQINEDEEYVSGQDNDMQQSEGLQYHAFDYLSKKGDRISQMTARSTGSRSPVSEHRVSQQLDVPRQAAGGAQRPTSSYALGSELRGRTLSPLSANGSDPSSGSPHRHSRDLSARRSYARPTSYIDMLNNVPHNQQVAPGGSLVQQSLQSIVGKGATLLDVKKTLDMYRANVKKSNDTDTQYEFAILMVNTARDATPDSDLEPAELIVEAKQILQRLADRASPFAQYYLGDGYFSGLFNKQKPDYDKAFPLFIAASKHGHAEAGYRAALCYEFGWGTAKAYPKAVQFYRNSASKNHPGAATRLGLACIRGDMGLNSREKYKEGVKWLKRAQESADMQYNAAPYELGLLHLTGYGDDIFKDEVYAAQLLTQAAGLGNMEANFLMGQAYENGLYECPKDAALSVHFYNGAATKGHAEAMMALCAWYMVGAEPYLERDETEAYAWAKMAADTGFVKAEYAMGFFTEMGIGCRRDPLEANVWYVRAADQGDVKAQQRLQIIRAAAAGSSEDAIAKADAKSKEKKKFMGIF